MITAIMPCKGRAEQTIRNVDRLLRTAGMDDWKLVLMVDHDPDLLRCLLAEPLAGLVAIDSVARDQHGYWAALAQGTQTHPEATHLVNLANDLLPGRHWLRRCWDAYQARFGTGDGLMGFNDGLHGPSHSPHFLISRGLLDRYGGWPTWYQHNFGDTEVCTRAQQDGVYGKAPWAVLYHDHLESGAADDAVYQAGRASFADDAARFVERKARGWPAVR